MKLPHSPKTVRAYSTKPNLDFVLFAEPTKGNEKEQKGVLVLINAVIFDAVAVHCKITGHTVDIWMQMHIHIYVCMLNNAKRYGMHG